MGMARVILDEGLHDATFIGERCENFESFKQSLEQYDLESVSNITGVPQEDIVKAARMYASNRPATIIYGMGVVHQSFGTDGSWQLPIWPCLPVT